MPHLPRVEDATVVALFCPPPNDHGRSCCALDRESAMTVAPRREAIPSMVSKARWRLRCGSIRKADSPGYVSVSSQRSQRCVGPDRFHRPAQTIDERCAMAPAPSVTTWSRACRRAIRDRSIGGRRERVTAVASSTRSRPGTKVMMSLVLADAGSGRDVDRTSDSCISHFWIVLQGNVRSFPIRSSL
jgi:hypothetical protein